MVFVIATTGQGNTLAATVYSIDQGPGGYFGYGRCSRVEAVLHQRSHRLSATPLKGS